VEGGKHGTGKGAFLIGEICDSHTTAIGLPLSEVVNAMERVGGAQTGVSGR